MSDLPTPHQDPIERFLESSGALTPSGHARQAILLQTQALVRHRRLRRKLGWVMALSACYLAGAVTMRLWLHTAISGPETPIVQRATEPQPALSPDAFKTGSEAPRRDQEQVAAVPVSIENDPDVPAEVVERMAAQSRDQRARLYRNAGDRYLRDLGDVEAAVRCYRRSLDSPEAELAFTAEDNWLLMALKQARQKEKNDAKNDA